MVRVLCIDDYAAGLRIRKTMLEARGCSVLTAESGARGLELLEEHAVDVVILDYRLQDMNGEEIARAIKKKRPALPILLLTGSPREVPPSLLWLVDAYVVKGQPPKKLLDDIQRLTGKQLEHSGAAALSEAIKEEIERSRKAVGVESPKRGTGTA